MAPKKNVVNGFSLFMLETKQMLAKRGMNISMANMPDYCKKDWEEMPAEKKEYFRVKAKKMKNEVGTDKYTSVGEKVEDVKRQSEENKSQSDAMYLYIEELIRVQPPSYYLPKHKFILIHVNPYTCDTEGFYFPAEISMAEFSLERGLIRIFHQLVGFDPIRTQAPGAPSGDINTHAKNNHQIGPFVKLSCQYTEILLKIIGFIINKDVNEDMLNDPNLDIPPIFTAHTSTGKELMITNLSLFQLYKSVVQYADRSDFNRLLSVYHLDKLFMEMKNVSHEIQHPNKIEKALPSVAMASDSLTKDVINTIVSIGCSYHEKLGYSHVCSNYYVCKWIYIISTHCCQYFNIKFIPGCHYDFNLSLTEIPFEQVFSDLKISKSDCIPNNNPKKKSQDLTAGSFPSFEGGLSTSVQRPVWSRPEHKLNTFKKNISIEDNNFPPLGDSQKNTPEAFPEVVGINSWRSNAGRGRGIISQVQNNSTSQLNENQIKSSKGRGFNINYNKQ